MALATTITPAQVAVALGQPAPSTGSVVEQQWATWIADQLMFIQDRADSLGVETIPQAKLDFVIREVVVDQVKRRDQANDYDIPENYRFRTVADWWPLLGLVGTSAGAYAVDVVGSASSHLPWCSVMFGATRDVTTYTIDDAGYVVPFSTTPAPVCSCGADIAGVPIFEGGWDL